MFLCELYRIENTLKYCCYGNVAFAYFKEKLADDYTVSFAGASTNTASLLKAEKTTVAVCSLTQAAELYNSTGADAQILCVNTVNGVFVLSKNRIRAGKDLVDENIYLAGEGSQIDYMLAAVLEKNSLETGEDVQVTYLKDEVEVMSAALDGTAQTVILTEPYASKVLAATDFKSSFDLGSEWASLGGEEMQCITGCVVVSRDFVNNNPDEVEKLIYQVEHIAEIEKELERTIQSGQGMHAVAAVSKKKKSLRP